MVIQTFMTCCVVGGFASPGALGQQGLDAQQSEKETRPPAERLAEAISLGDFLQVARWCDDATSRNLTIAAAKAAYQPVWVIGQLKGESEYDDLVAAWWTGLEAVRPEGARAAFLERKEHEESARELGQPGDMDAKKVRAWLKRSRELDDALLGDLTKDQQRKVFEQSVRMIKAFTGSDASLSPVHLTDDVRAAMVERELTGAQRMAAQLGGDIVEATKHRWSQMPVGSVIVPTMEIALVPTDQPERFAVKPMNSLTLSYWAKFEEDDTKDG